LPYLPVGRMNCVSQEESLSESGQEEVELQKKS